ncbi:MAG: PASTA domain-containing protein [candidate division Zixibacteria bacterium]|nr:PASTA domain-containing protein [candidate division Zixibacteria bacterium]
MNIKNTIIDKWKPITVALAVFFGGIFIFALLMDQVVMPIAVRHGDECLVPDITYMSRQAAEIKLKESNLQITVALEEFNAQHPKGTVISQLPESGASVKTGMKVRVTISKGAASATVPRLRGISLREAKLLIEQEGLVMGDLLWYTDEVLPDGVIIESRPDAATVMKLNAEVQLVVNRKQTDVLIPVPDFIGLDFSEAQQVAEENYIIIGDISYKVDDRMLPETILYQSIPPETEVVKWTIINLTISQLE